MAFTNAGHIQQFNTFTTDIEDDFLWLTRTAGNIADLANIFAEYRIAQAGLARAGLTKNTNYRLVI